MLTGSHLNDGDVTTVNDSSSFQHGLRTPTSNFGHPLWHDNDFNSASAFFRSRQSSKKHCKNGQAFANRSHLRNVLCLRSPNDANAEEMSRRHTFDSVSCPSSQLIHLKQISIPSDSKDGKGDATASPTSIASNYATTASTADLKKRPYKHHLQLSASYVLPDSSQLPLSPDIKHYFGPPNASSSTSSSISNSPLNNSSSISGLQTKNDGSSSLFLHSSLLSSSSASSESPMDYVTTPFHNFQTSNNSARPINFLLPQSRGLRETDRITESPGGLGVVLNDADSCDGRNGRSPIIGGTTNHKYKDNPYFYGSQSDRQIGAPVASAACDVLSNSLSNNCSGHGSLQQGPKLFPHFSPLPFPFPSYSPPFSSNFPPPHQQRQRNSHHNKRKLHHNHSNNHYNKGKCNLHRRGVCCCGFNSRQENFNSQSCGHHDWHGDSNFHVCGNSPEETLNTSAAMHYSDDCISAETCDWASIDDSIISFSVQPIDNSNSVDGDANHYVNDISPPFQQQQQQQQQQNNGKQQFHWRSGNGVCSDQQRIHINPHQQGIQDNNFHGNIKKHNNNSNNNNNYNYYRGNFYHYRNSAPISIFNSNADNCSTAISTNVSGLPTNPSGKLSYHQQSFQQSATIKSEGFLPTATDGVPTPVSTATASSAMTRSRRRGGNKSRTTRQRGQQRPPAVEVSNLANNDPNSDAKMEAVGLQSTISAVELSQYLAKEDGNGASLSAHENNISEDAVDVTHHAAVENTLTAAIDTTASNETVEVAATGRAEPSICVPRAKLRLDNGPTNNNIRMREETDCNCALQSVVPQLEEIYEGENTKNVTSYLRPAFYSYECDAPGAILPSRQQNNHRNHPRRNHNHNQHMNNYSSTNSSVCLYLAPRRTRNCRRDAPTHQYYFNHHHDKLGDFSVKNQPISFFPSDCGNNNDNKMLHVASQEHFMQPQPQLMSPNLVGDRKCYWNNEAFANETEAIRAGSVQPLFPSPSLRHPRHLDTVDDSLLDHEVTTSHLGKADQVDNGRGHQLYATPSCRSVSSTATTTGYTPSSHNDMTAESLPTASCNTQMTKKDNCFELCLTDCFGGSPGDEADQRNISSKRKNEFAEAGREFRQCGDSGNAWHADKKGHTSTAAMSAPPVGSVPNTACNTSDPFMEKAASSLSNLDQSSSASTLPHNDDSRIIATYDINNTDGFNCAQFPKEDVQDCFVKSVQNALQVWIADSGFYNRACQAVEDFKMWLEGQNICTTASGFADKASDVDISLRDYFFRDASPECQYRSVRQVTRFWEPRQLYPAALLKYIYQRLKYFSSNSPDAHNRQLGGMMRRIGGASKMNDKSHTPAFRCFKDITTAIVPIIQVIHVSTGVHLDISAQTPHACATSRVLRRFGMQDPRLRDVIILTKLWAKHRGLCNAQRRFPSAYAYSLCAVNFFQSLGLLPLLDTNNGNIFTLMTQFSSSPSLASLPSPSTITTAHHRGGPVVAAGSNCTPSLVCSLPVQQYASQCHLSNTPNLPYSPTTFHNAPPTGNMSIHHGSGDAQHLPWQLQSWPAHLNSLSHRNFVDDNIPGAFNAIDFPQQHTRHSASSGVPSLAYGNFNDRAFPTSATETKNAEYSATSPAKPAGSSQMAGFAWPAVDGQQDRRASTGTANRSNIGSKGSGGRQHPSTAGMRQMEREVIEAMATELAMSLTTTTNKTSDGAALNGPRSAREKETEQQNISSRPLQVLFASPSFSPSADTPTRQCAPKMARETSPKLLPPSNLKSSELQQQIFSTQFHNASGNRDKCSRGANQSTSVLQEAEVFDGVPLRVGSHSICIGFPTVDCTNNNAEPCEVGTATVKCGPVGLQTVGDDGRCVSLFVDRDDDECFASTANHFDDNDFKECICDTETTEMSIKSTSEAKHSRVENGKCGGSEMEKRTAEFDAEERRTTVLTHAAESRNEKSQNAEGNVCDSVAPNTALPRITSASIDKSSDSSSSSINSVEGGGFHGRNLSVAPDSQTAMKIDATTSSACLLRSFFKFMQMHMYRTLDITLHDAPDSNGVCFDVRNPIIGTRACKPLDAQHERTLRKELNRAIQISFNSDATFDMLCGIDEPLPSSPNTVVGRLIAAKEPQPRFSDEQIVSPRLSLPLTGEGKIHDGGSQQHLERGEATTSTSQAECAANKGRPFQNISDSSSNTTTAAAASQSENCSCEYTTAHSPQRHTLPKLQADACQALASKELFTSPLPHSTTALGNEWAGRDKKDWNLRDVLKPQECCTLQIESATKAIGCDDWPQAEGEGEKNGSAVGVGKGTASVEEAKKKCEGVGNLYEGRDKGGKEKNVPKHPLPFGKLVSTYTSTRACQPMNGSGLIGRRVSLPASTVISAAPSLDMSQREFSIPALHT